jgi:hypothetical protein
MFKKLPPFLLFLAAVLPAITLGFFIAKYSVNVPFWDDWETPGRSFEKIVNGRLSFSYFLSQHNEHRVFFPRLIIIPLALITHWNVQYNMLVSLLIAGMTSLGIYQLNRVTVGGSKATGLFLAFLSNLLIFSLVQYENWLWGLQIAFFMPMLCCVWGLVTLRSPLSPARKTGLCIALSTVSTFSLASGFLCWVILLPVLLLSQDWQTARHKWRMLLTWLIAFVLNFLVYTYQYYKPAQDPAFLKGSVGLFQAVSYFLGFLGSSLAASDLARAQAIGFCLWFSFVGLAIGLLRQPGLRERTLPWFALGTYVMAAATVTTAGRLGLGVAQSLSPRYTTTSVYLMVALIHLVAIALQQVRLSATTLSARSPRSLKVLLNGGIVLLVMVFFWLHLQSSLHGAAAMKTVHRDRLYAKSCLIFIKVIDSKCSESLFPSRPLIIQRATQAERLGLLDPDLATSRNIQTFKGEAAGKTVGYFEGLEKVSPNRYAARGWAILPDRQRSSDAVLLTYNAPPSEKTIFLISPIRKFRQDVATFLSDSTYENSGWETSFSLRRLPKGRLKVQAWAFDATTRTAYKLQGSYIVQH